LGDDLERFEHRGADKSVKEMFNCDVYKRSESGSRTCELGRAGVHVGESMNPGRAFTLFELHGVKKSEKSHFLSDFEVGRTY